MFKYNNLSPMQPLTEESEPISDLHHTSSSEPTHELTGQDAAIITRIKEIQDVMESLKQRLSAERNNLARERMEAASMFTYQSVPMIPDRFTYSDSFHNLPPSYYYNGMEATCSSTGSVENYETIPGPYNQVYNNYQNRSNQNLLIDTVSETYREHLREVERMCRHEFNKMQDSIRSLRKIKLPSIEHSSEEEIQTGSSIMEENKRSRGHKKHHRRDRGDNYRHRAQAQNQTVLDEHKSHYYYHYRDNSLKRKYLNGRQAKSENGDEHSGDSAETSGTLWHLDSPYESDY